LFVYVPTFVHDTDFPCHFPHHVPVCVVAGHLNIEVMTPTTTTTQIRASASGERCSRNWMRMTGRYPRKLRAKKPRICSNCSDINRSLHSSLTLAPSRFLSASRPPCHAPSALWSERTNETQSKTYKSARRSRRDRRKGPVFLQETPLFPRKNSVFP